MQQFQFSINEGKGKYEQNIRPINTVREKNIVKHIYLLCGPKIERRNCCYVRGGRLQRVGSFDVEVEKYKNKDPKNKEGSIGCDGTFCPPAGYLFFKI